MPHLPRVAPYGSWESPIAAKLIAEGGMRLSHVETCGSSIYWNELRPAEGGRCVVVRYEAGQAEDMIPPPFNARSSVHEYGGGAYLATRDAFLFSNFTDQRLYRAHKDGTVQAITPISTMRYADGIMDGQRRRIICVREDHAQAGAEPVNTIVSIDPTACEEGTVLVSGNDFYAAPRLSPDGSRLAWLTWNHPRMPWDAAELWIASIRKDGALGSAEHIAGGPNESVTQPEWSPDGTLHFVSDRTNWWNLYRLTDAGVEPVLLMDAEFGGPQWRFSASSYAFMDEDRMICTYCRDGFWRLASMETHSGHLQDIETPYTSISDLHVGDGHAVFIAGSPIEPDSVVQMDLQTYGMRILQRASSTVIDKAYISVPEPVEFPTENRLTAHALYYGPANPKYAGQPDEKPPLVVMIHGGPTSATRASLRLGIQYYTSRGIAVLDVNYGGSTGYGRAYRERLYGEWGVVDVDDCVNGARYLADRGLADPKRLAITGGSAGGYTVLSALTFRDTFKAGASHFGVSDCEALARDTHKFESRYLDTLIGAYPQERELYIERSPLHHTDRLSCPVIFFQGLEDRIVPPDQAERMVSALRERGIAVAYVPFEGEQHGFRKSQNIERALEGELYFFSKVLGFEIADVIDPVEIKNLEAVASDPSCP